MTARHGWLSTIHRWFLSKSYRSNSLKELESPVTSSKFTRTRSPDLDKARQSVKGLQALRDSHVTTQLSSHITKLRQLNTNTESLTQIQELSEEITPSKMNAKSLSLREVENLLRLHDEGENKPSQAVLVALDYEAFEFNQAWVTETGVTVLDLSTLDPNIPKADFQKHWQSKTRSVHYITTEWRKHVNKRFVKGNPDKFNFGKSQLVSRWDLAKVLARIFRDPSNLELAHDLSIPIADRRREIILVGHSLKNEFKYGQTIGFSPGNVVSKCDTLFLSKLGQKSEELSLDKLLSLLNVEQNYLHNAGNDAAYTMQALLALAVQHVDNPVQLQQGFDQLFAASRARKIAQQAAKNATPTSG